MNAVIRRLDEMERRILLAQDTTLDTEHAAKYLCRAVATLNKLCSENKIKYHKPEGGNRVFYKSDLDAFIRKYPINPKEAYD